LIVDKECSQEYLQILLNALSNKDKKSIKSNVFPSPYFPPDYPFPILSICRGFIPCETAVYFTGLFGSAFNNHFKAAEEWKRRA
jgi:hypothetical protein